MQTHTFGYPKLHMPSPVFFWLFVAVASGLAAFSFTRVRDLNFSSVEKMAIYQANSTEAAAHGTKSSQVRREFKNKSLIFHYEVPQGSSIAELHFKLQPQELSSVSTLRIQARRVLGNSYPENFRVEIKSGDRAVRAFQGKMTKQWSWQQLDFPLQSHGLNGVYADEVTLVITHAKVAPKTKGALEIDSVSFW